MLYTCIHVHYVHILKTLKDIYYLDNNVDSVVPLTINLGVLGSIAAAAAADVLSSMHIYTLHNVKYISYGLIENVKITFQTPSSLYHIYME